MYQHHQHNTSVKYHMYNVTLSEQHGPGQSPAPLTVTVCAPELGMLPGATTPPFQYTLRPEVGIRRFQFPLRAAAPTYLRRDNSNSRRLPQACAVDMRCSKMLGIDQQKYVDLHIPHVFSIRLYTTHTYKLFT